MKCTVELIGKHDISTHVTMWIYIELYCVCQYCRLAVHVDVLRRLRVSVTSTFSRRYSLPVVELSWLLYWDAVDLAESEIGEPEHVCV